MYIFSTEIICIPVLLLILSTTRAQECDFTFNISSLVGSVLNVEEKSNLSFNFTFGSTLCRITDSHVITVAKLDDRQEVTTVSSILSFEAGLTIHTGRSSLNYTPLHVTTTDQSSDSSGESSHTVDTTSALLTLSETTADVGDPPPVERSVNITQYIALIAAFAAIVIAIVACRRVGRGRKRFVINRGDQTSFSMRASRRSCRESVAPDTDESNYYWVQCLPVTCTPTESREVIEGTDGAENVLPFYGNTTLRAVRSAGDLLDNVVNPTSSLTPGGRNHSTAGNRHHAKNSLAHYNSLPVVHYIDASSSVLPAIREVSKTSQNQETAAHVEASVRDAAKGFLRSAQSLPRCDLSVGYVPMSGRVRPCNSLPTRRKFGNNVNIAMSETSEYTTEDDYLTPTASLLSRTAAATESRKFNVLPLYENSVLRPADSDDSDFTFNIPSLVGSVLNVEEKSNVSFNFTFGSTLCRITDSHVITVTKQGDKLEVTSVTSTPNSEEDLTTLQDNVSSTTDAPPHVTTSDHSDYETEEKTTQTSAGHNSYAVDMTVVTSIGITAFAAIAITCTIVVFRGKRFGAHDVERWRSRRSQVVRRSRHEDNRVAPKPCVRLASPAGYLHPAESGEVIEGTDGAENVLPFYENSTLRAVRSAGDLLDNVVNPTSSLAPGGRNHYTAGNRHHAKNFPAHYNSLPVVHYTDASSTVLPATREVSKTSQNQETAAHVEASVRDAAKGFKRSEQTLPRCDLSVGYVPMSGRVTGSLPTRKFGNNMNIAMSETSEYTTVDNYLTPTATLLAETAATNDSRTFNVLPLYENSVLRPADSDDSDSFSTDPPCQTSPTPV
ncbi:hypothetical protein BaRGS_00035332 [Batillaria attramentaria]|uniref:Uncharacterized protein n=1 Tax=Batillaria attramentaria TaxID=370345 RepID=A0ABD0JER7_9CAEN